jgi:hypothetical protein
MVVTLLILLMRPAFSSMSACANHGHSQRVCFAADSASGAYNLTVGGEVWFESAPTAVHIDGQWYTSGNGMLAWQGSHQAEGNDRLGSFTRLQFDWSASARNRTWPVEMAVRMYHASNAVVFEQYFSRGLPKTATRSRGYGVRSATDPLPDTPSTAFPAFDCRRGKLGEGGLGFLAWEDRNTAMEKRGLGAKVTSGLFQGSGPEFELVRGGLFGGGVLSLSEHHGSYRTTTAVLSQLSHFFTGSFSYLPDRTELRFGVLGGILSVPAHTRIETMLYVSQGVNAAYEGWGRQLLKWHGKPRVGPAASSVVRYPVYYPSSIRNTTFSHPNASPSSLGYSTTAFYFYHSRTQGKPRVHTSYSDTLLAVASDKPKLPYRYFLVRRVFQKGTFIVWLTRPSFVRLIVFGMARIATEAKGRWCGKTLQPRRGTAG